MPLISLASLSTLLLVLEHLCSSRTPTVHAPATPSHGIGQNQHAQNLPEHASRRGDHALGAPGRRALERPTPPLQRLALHRASTPRPLSPRHTRGAAAALSPSSSSDLCRGYRRRHCTRPNDSVVLSLRPLHLEHRQDNAYKMPSFACPFERRRCRAMTNPPRHPQHLTSAINRGAPSTNSSQHHLSSHLCFHSTPPLTRLTPEPPQFQDRSRRSSQITVADSRRPEPRHCYQTLLHR
jgi:hypothetical protein